MENEAWRRKYFVIFRPKWALSLATFLHQNSGHFAKIVSSDASPNVKRVLDLKYDYRNSNAIARETDSKKDSIHAKCKILKLFEFLAKWVLYTYLLQKLFFFKTDTIRRIWISILRKFMALAWKEKKITRDFSLSCCYYNSFFSFLTFISCVFRLFFEKTHVTTLLKVDKCWP